MSHDELDPTPTIRPARPADDPALAAIHHDGMCEFLGAPSETGAVSVHFAGVSDRYFVVACGGKVCGGAGLKAQNASTVELQRMYFAPTLRGRGVGRRLLEFLLTTARELGFTTIELETSSNMHAARHLYESLGFVEEPVSSAGSGGTRCDRRYARSL